MAGKTKLTSGMADVNGARLYYEVQGTGAPLLLLHAGVADSGMWDAQVDVFAESYRVIRFDFRGFGRSTMPAGSFTNHEDVRALLAFLEIEAAYVAGFSFGGLVALDFALAYPTSVKGVFCISPEIS